MPLFCVVGGGVGFGGKGNGCDVMKGCGAVSRLGCTEVGVSLENSCRTAHPAALLQSEELIPQG